MPDLHFWFICLRAFVVAFAGAITTSLVQLSGTQTPIAGTTWLIAVLAGLVASVNAGHAAWPTPAVSMHPRRRRHRHGPSRHMPPSPPVPPV